MKLSIWIISTSLWGLVIWRKYWSLKSQKASVATMERTGNSQSPFPSHQVTIISQRMRKIRPWFLSQGLNQETSSLPTRSLKTSMTWSCKMILIQKDTLSGSFLGWPILERVKRLSLICWTWSSLRVFIMRAWKSSYIPRKGKTKQLTSQNQLKRKRSASKVGTEGARTFLTSRIITGKTSLSRLTIKGAITPSHSPTPLRMTTIKYTLLIHSHTLTLI